MLGGLRFRPIGWAAAVGTLAAMAATLTLAAPGDATPGPEKRFDASFEANCILAPGVLNEKGTIKVHTEGEAPSTVEKGEVFALRNSRISVATPKQWGETLFSVGSRSAKGFVTHITMIAENAEPARLNIAQPPEFPSGLPIKTEIENREVEFTVPSEERRFTAGPWKVTGSKGEEVLLSIGTEAGYKEVTPGHVESTNEGIQSEITSFDESGEANIGPVQVACTLPANVVLSALPITGEGSPTTTSSSTTTTKTTATTTTTTPELPGPCHDICPSIDDKLTGSVTIRKLQQKIALPTGCTFQGELRPPSGPFANIKCPPFTAPIKLFGALQVTVGLRLNGSEPVTGGTELNEPPGMVTITGTARENVEITSLGAFGQIVPLSCKTAEPVVFALNWSATQQELITTGATTHGEATLPAVQCNGFAGGLVGSLLTLVISGSNNPYTLTIAP